MAEMDRKNPNGFTPRTGGNGKNGKNYKINKNGVLALVFLALVAVIIIVLIIFLIKAITTPSQERSSEQTSQSVEDTTNKPTDPPEPSDSQIIYINRDNLYTGDLIVVNGSHGYVDVGENNLISLYNQPYFKTAYRLRDAKVALRFDIVQNFADMMRDLKAAFSSASLADDYLLIQNAGIVNDPSAVIDYTNENASGLSFDIRVYIAASGKNRRLNADEQAWLASHCAEYGFVLRYGEGKEDYTGTTANLFHFRYVGIPHSTYMNLYGFCLEEYIELLKNYSYSSPLTVNAGGASYKIYYAAASGASTAAYVPSGSEYTISGDNIGGFIITVKQ